VSLPPQRAAGACRRWNAAATQLVGRCGMPVVWTVARCWCLQDSNEAPVDS
jgi:hypothetical protein